MVQGYYTLQEAAQYLGMPADELKQMAQKNQIRSFQDRGTLRFRIQDIQELGRQRGVSSDPELRLGDASLDKPAAPRSPRTPAKKESTEVFDFEFDADAKVDLGSEVGSKSRSAASPRGGPRSGSAPRSSGARTPALSKPEGSDSDIKLVSDGNDIAFAKSGSDSDVKLKEKDSDVRVPDSRPTPRPKTGMGGKPGSGARSPRPPSTPQPVDSGVRLVPMDSDSDVKIVGASDDEIPLGEQPEASAADSNVRLEKVHFPPKAPEEDTMMLTEEINLDEEIKKQEEALKAQAKKPTRMKPKSELKMPPQTSPFELSESDVGSTEQVTEMLSDSSDFDLVAPKEGSSDFDLSAADSDPGVDGASSGDFSLELGDDGSVLDGDSDERGLTAPSSGISLGNPVDGGISLEEGDVSGDSVDFDLSLEAEATPRPAQMKPVAESDSEFELSLETDVPAGGDSDSEFELTLDDSNDELSGHMPQAKGDQDIFESDFEIPALSEDGAEESPTIDTELESSDFDIALDDSELAAEEESGSQVVALDEEVVEDGEEGLAEIDESAVTDDDVEADEEEVETGRVREVVKVIKPAPWGVVPALVMFPTVVVMLLVGFLGFELVQSAAGYRPPGVMSKMIGEMIGADFAKR